MSPLAIAISILYIIFCIIMVGLILSQEGKQQGLGTLSGGNTDTYWAKIKGHTKEGIIPKLTTVFAVLFLAVSILIGMNLV